MTTIKKTSSGISTAVSMNNGPPYSLSDFTPREIVVANYYMKGLSNKEVARLLDVAETTVKQYCQAIYGKAGVKTRGQFVSWYAAQPDQKDFRIPYAEQLPEIVHEYIKYRKTLTEKKLRFSELTPEEGEIVLMLTMGRTYQEIAEARKMTSQEMAHTMSLIRRSIGVQHDTQLAAAFHLADVELILIERIAAAAPAPKQKQQFKLAVS